jgi:phosphoribosyl-ATP pyrophosphohydrolase/phosphoribosyl-AMP cyclohydrolase
MEYNEQREHFKEGGGVMDAPACEALVAGVRFDASGLVPAVAQDALTGEVRMVAFMSREALSLTLSTGVAHFHSRSRGALWKKGESSGNTLAVRRVMLDCDGDCVLLLVDPAGPTCHTGAPSCFAREATAAGWSPAAPTPTAASELSATIEARRDGGAAQRSYTRTLLDQGADAIGAKLREEADELARATASETPARVASEAGDVVYHLMVALASRGVSWRAVLAELARRAGRSGLDEKASRRG